MQETFKFSCLKPSCGGVLSVVFGIDEREDRETWDVHPRCGECGQSYDVVRKDWSDDEGVGYDVRMYDPDAESVNYRPR